MSASGCSGGGFCRGECGGLRLREAISRGKRSSFLAAEGQSLPLLEGVKVCSVCGVRGWWGIDLGSAVVLRKGRTLLSARALKSGGVRRYASAECQAAAGHGERLGIGIGYGRRGQCRRRYVGGMLHGRGGRGMRRQCQGCGGRARGGAAPRRAAGA